MRVLVLAVLLAGCSMPTGPDIPEGAVPFEPPDFYSGMWVTVQADAKMTGSIERVRWFIVPGGLFSSREEGARSSGRWLSDGRIYLAEGWQYDRNTVRHEMLHELLKGDHEHKHPLFQIYNAQICLNPTGAPVPCS